MGWGAMIGGGQGLQQAGAMVGEHFATKNKQKFEAELEEKRAAREEARKIREEERAKVRLETTADPKQTRFQTDGDGVTWEVVRSSTGNELERRLAAKDDVDALRREQAKEQVDIDSKLADIAYKRALTGNAGLQGAFTEQKLELYPEEAASRIDANRARAEASRANANRTSAAPSGSARDYGDELVRQSPGLEARYGGEGGLTKAEMADVAMKTYETVYMRKGRPATSQDLAIALEDYVKRTRGKKGKNEQGNGAKFKIQE